MHFILSASPQTCSNGCQCFFFEEEEANVLNCSNTPITDLNNLEIPEETTWLVADSNKINRLCAKLNFGNITHVDLHSSQIVQICGDFFQDLALSTKIKYLNLADNKMTKFTRDILQVSTLEEVYIAGNPIECTCDTIWFADWLLNSTTPYGVRIVRDYKNVACFGGEWNGTRVYELNAVKMGCFSLAT